MGHPMAKKGLRKRGDKVFRTKKSFNESRYSKNCYDNTNKNDSYNDLIVEKHLKNALLDDAVS